MSEYKFCPFSSFDTIKLNYSADKFPQEAIDNLSKSVIASTVERDDGIIEVSLVRGFCAEDECALWDAVHECCCIKSRGK